jgi:hypothetical protein
MKRDGCKPGYHKSGNKCIPNKKLDDIVESILNYLEIKHGFTPAMHPWHPYDEVVMVRPTDSKDDFETIAINPDKLDVEFIRDWTLYADDGQKPLLDYLKEQEAKI